VKSRHLVRRSRGVRRSSGRWAPAAPPGSHLPGTPRLARAHRRAVVVRAEGEREGVYSRDTGRGNRREGEGGGRHAHAAGTRECDACVATPPREGRSARAGVSVRQGAGRRPLFAGGLRGKLCPQLLTPWPRPTHPRECRVCARRHVADARDCLAFVSWWAAEIRPAAQPQSGKSVGKVVLAVDE